VQHLIRATYIRSLHTRSALAAAANRRKPPQHRTAAWSGFYDVANIGMNGVPWMSIGDPHTLGDTMCAALVFTRLVHASEVGKG
jgi:hypothetical protein